MKRQFRLGHLLYSYPMRSSAIGDTRAIAGTAVFASVIAWSCGLQNTPFIDDWTYAWSVEHLLRTSEIRILDWSASPNVAADPLGTLFCVPSGFSFTALRISTWVASVLGVIGVFRLLRVGGVSVRDALLGACLLEACPVFLILSFTFMTDILWLTPAIWFAYALVKAVQARSNAWLITATIFGCIAGAVRVTGAALPLVAMAVLWFHTSG